MTTVRQMMQENDNRKLVRKIQKAVAFLGKSDVDLPEELFDTSTGLVDLKTAGWLPVGMVSPDGYTFGREPESEDINALGYASPIRSDTTVVARSISFTPLETGRKHLFELTYGTDLSGVTMDPSTGEVVFDEPDLPIDAEYRLLVIGADGPADEQWVLGKGYYSVKLQTTAEQVWGTEGALSSQLTFNVFSGESSGVPVRHYMGGTGSLKYQEVTGFDLATAA